MAATINFGDFGETGNESRGNSASGSARKPSFADQLTDQFLTCPLCSQFLRQPKILSCQHTFCSECIESHYEMDESDRPYRFLLSYNRDISCPVCRTRTPMPTGGLRRLPDNFVVANLADVIIRRKPSIGAGGHRRSSSAHLPSTAFCDVCLARSALSGSSMTSSTSGLRASPMANAASFKCLDCVKLLCADCAELHKRTKVTADHVLYSASVEQEVECKVHPNETLRFYCEKCESCICVLCTFDGHSEHPVTSLLEGVQRQKAGFERMIGDCRRRMETVRDQLRLIDGCQIGLQRAEDRIRDAAIEAIATVRRREAQLMSDLKRAVGDQTLTFIADRKSIEGQLEELMSASGIAEKLIGGGSSVSCGVEMLMNQRNIRDRLTSALNIQVRHTPEGLRRTFQLLPADCFSAETEKSELFQLANNYGTESDDDDDEVEMADMQVQTDCEIALKSAADARTWTGDDFMRLHTTVGCQVSGTDGLVVVRPVITAPSIEYVCLLPPSVHQPRARDDVTPLVPIANSNVQSSRRGSVQNRWPMEKSNSLSQDGPIQQRPSTVWSYTLPKAATVEMVDSCVGSDPVETSDAGTLTAGPITAEKETSTPHVIVVHKNVSTENQTMVDKSTTTATSDVTSAYRGSLQTTTARRTVTVSRGTATSKPTTTDRATSPVRGWAPPTPFLVTSASFSTVTQPTQQPAQKSVTKATAEPPSPGVAVASGNGQITIRTTQQGLTPSPSSLPPPKPTQTSSTSSSQLPSTTRLTMMATSTGRK